MKPSAILTVCTALIYADVHMTRCTIHVIFLRRNDTYSNTP